MYIDKWWNDSVGGTDDSMLLIDYFNEKNKKNVTFNEIVTDLHMDDVLGKQPVYEFERGFYYGSEDRHYDFDINADVIIDLAALLLQCLVEGSVTMNNNATPSKQISFTIFAEKVEIRMLVSELENIIEHSNLYFPDFLQDEFAECVDGVKEICDKLQGYC